MNFNSKDYWERGYSPNGDLPNNKNFYIDLLEILYREYINTGNSPLVRYLINTKPQIDYISYSILYSLNEHFLYDSAVPDLDNEATLPGFESKKNKYSLKSNQQKNSNTMKYDNDINAFILKLDNNGKAYYISRSNAKNDITPYDEASKAADTNPAHEATPNTDVSPNCEIKANRDINSMDVKKLNQDVKPKDEEITAANVSDYYNSDVTFNAEPKPAAENKISMEQIKRIVEQKLQENKLQMQDAYNKELEHIRYEYSNLTSSQKQHQDMINSTNAIQSEIGKFSGKLDDIRQYMDNAQLDIDNVQHDIYEKIRAWQKSLYPQQLEPIARVFLSVFYNSERAHDLMQTVISDPSNDNIPQELRQKITSLNKGLEIAQIQFERALKCFNISVYYPKPGEPFDDSLHADINDAIAGPNTVIKRLVAPGLIRESVLGDDGDIIFPAEVETETK